MQATRTELHDRATRGIALSSEDQAELEAWYTQQDAEERLLHENGKAAYSARSSLREQIDGALTQLAVVTQQIQMLSQQNENLRQEVSDLQLMLVRRMETQTA